MTIQDIDRELEPSKYNATIEREYFIDEARIKEYQVQVQYLQSNIAALETLLLAYRMSNSIQDNNDKIRLTSQAEKEYEQAKEKLSNEKER